MTNATENTAMTEERLREIEAVTELGGRMSSFTARELLAEVRRLQEAARNRSEGGWNPISEAPKDGSMFVTSNEGGGISVSFYTGDYLHTRVVGVKFWHPLSPLPALHKPLEEK